MRPLVRVVLAPNPNMMTGPGTNTYVLGRTGPFTVVDPGPADESHLDAIQAAAPEIGAILCTHSHADHSPGAAGLAARTGAPVLGFGPMLHPGVEHDDDTFAPDRRLADGDVVDGVDHRLVALHTPGHASNHLCYRLEDDGPGRAGPTALLTGDHVMQGSTVVIAPLDGDMAEYLRQLRRIADLGVDRFLPGHGHPIEDPAAEVARLLAHRAAREDQVAAALAELAVATPAQIVEAVYTHIGAELREVACLSTWAILRQLSAEGRAEARPTEDEIGSVWAVAGGRQG